MKSIRKITAVVLMVLMLMSFAGCAESDTKTVVAKINGVEYTKADFNEFYNFYLFTQAAYGTPLTGTDEEMAEYKANMFLEYVLRLTLKAECETLGIADNAAVVSESAKALIDQAKTTFPETDDYADFLDEYGYTEETVTGVAEKMLKIFDYANIFTESGADNKFDERIAATVGDVEIPMSTFYYYALVNYIANAMNGSASEFYDTENFYSNIYSYIVTGVKAIQYLEENDIEIPEENIAEKEDTLFTLDLYGLTDYARDVCYLTNEQIDKGFDFVVKTLAAQDVILDEYKKTLSFTDSELEAYYNSSQYKYDESTVKAYHILTEDEEFAKQMLAETNNTADGYMAVYEKYGKDEKVVQAVDLGEFKKGQMVEEFEDCAFGLKAGEIGMCETSFGFHIVYVYDNNPVETTFEASKEKVLEDYTADHIQYFGQSHMEELLEDYKDEAGDFRIVPINLLTDYLYEKYDVEHNVIIAVR